jgi:hypothetical protein
MAVITVAYIVATIMSICGGAMLFLPVGTLLRIDRKKGYQLYVQAPNEEIGLERARSYYRRAGLALALTPWLILAGVLWLMQ